MKQQVVPLSHYQRRQRTGQDKGQPRNGRTRSADEHKWVHEREILLAELEVRNEELQVAWQELERQSVELREIQAELQRARLENEAVQERHSQFYECSPVAYFTLTADGTICQFNHCGAQLLGAERRLLVNKRFGLFIEPSDRAVFNGFLAAVFAGGKESCTVTLRNPDGHGDPVIAHLEAVRRESGLTCSVVALDVTERRRAETVLENYRAELEATVAERTAELSAANQELESFAYAASHDMKAPLTRLSSLSNLLARQYQAQLEGDGQVLLNLIQQNALRLNSLVDDLLAHTQIRKQPLSVQTLDIAAVVQAVLRELAEEIQQKRADVRLNLPADLQVQADPFNLAQILRNLVENALKYSIQGKSPVIEIGTQVSNGACRLWVRDNGIGISKAYHQRIFEIFQRLHTYSEYPGTGVGLALVRKAIERMGGRVWVESELGQGAAFHLEWPSSPHKCFK